MSRVGEYKREYYEQIICEDNLFQKQQEELILIYKELKKSGCDLDLLSKLDEANVKLQSISIEILYNSLTE